MQKKIKIIPICEKQLNKAMEYIAENSPKQAQIMHDQFYNTLSKIEKQPSIGRPYKKGMRKIKLGKFRYNIYYKVKDEYISIRGIWHTSRGTEFEDN
ncbi:MAG: type II toxin-antitoxin system RelE/ParE family toxin [Fibromonadaceae bacterium]|jgi:plasmid stabilization system protein ParE|nr:type II toxin-antitoxin system RelE/ParE family toxin [Fibromonadaceae bacterium]